MFQKIHLFALLKNTFASSKGTLKHTKDKEKQMSLKLRMDPKLAGIKFGCSHLHSW